MSARRRRPRLKAALAGLALVACALAALAWLKLASPSIEPYRGLILPASRAAPGTLEARYMGVTTVLLSDGRSQLLVDSYLTRPGLARLLLGKVAPDRARIRAALDHAGIARLDGVLVAHSHVDHALDAPAVATATGALLVGSRSTANLARGQDFPEARLRVARGGERFRLGRFMVTVFRSRHPEPDPYPGEIAAPLPMPAAADAFREGGSLSYLVEHDGFAVLLHSAADYVPGMYRGVRADMVFLAIGGLGGRDAAFADAYWREVVRATGARLVIGTHWDDLLQPLDRELRPMPPLIDDFPLVVGRIEHLARRDGIRFGLMQAFAPADLRALAGPLSGRQR